MSATRPIEGVLDCNARRPTRNACWTATQEHQQRGCWTANATRSNIERALYCNMTPKLYVKLRLLVQALCVASREPSSIGEQQSSEDSAWVVSVATGLEVDFDQGRIMWASGCHQYQMCAKQKEGGDTSCCMRSLPCPLGVACAWILDIICPRVRLLVLHYASLRCQQQSPSLQ